MTALPTVGPQRSLREHVGDTLRGLIITGVLAEGTLHSAPRLAAEFGVSATPVREAMLDLVAEGLVEPVKNKGFRVTTMRPEDLDALAELRGLIEIPVMVSVARECQGEVAEVVAGLRSVARAMVEAAQGHDLARFVQLDTEFHLRFLALHGNSAVVDTVRDLRARSRLYGLQALAADGSLAGNALEHEALVDAALERDTERMKRLMIEHIGHVRSLWAGADGP